MDIHKAAVVITGGAQGLGRAMAEGLASKGAELALVDLNEDRLAETVSMCTSAGANARSYVADVSDETEVARLFNDVVRDFGRVDALINNAGILRDGLLVSSGNGKVTDRLSLDAWQSVIDVNLTGVFLCAREAAEKMIAQDRKGCILNISSISREGYAGQSNYSAAKAGVAALTVTWARELAKSGIRCAGIAPGVFETEMIANLTEEAKKRLEKNIPLKRAGTMEEIAHAAAFILENDIFTGRILEIDGGLRF